jgi:hypothetical protein
LVTRRLKSLIGPPVVAVAVLVFLVEETLWGWLTQFTAALGRLPAVARIEAAIRHLPPYLAILLFVVPWAIILPVKLMALWLLATGHAASGVLLFASGELFGVGFLARIYVLCRPALSTLGWFVRIEGWVLAVRDWAHHHLERIVLWRRTKKRIHAAIARVRGFFQQDRHVWLAARLKAVHRLVRAQFQR